MHRKLQAVLSLVLSTVPSKCMDPLKAIYYLMMTDLSGTLLKILLFHLQHTLTSESPCPSLLKKKKSGVPLSSLSISVASAIQSYDPNLKPKSIISIVPYTPH